MKGKNYPASKWDFFFARVENLSDEMISLINKAKFSGRIRHTRQDMSPLITNLEFSTDFLNGP